MQRRERLRRYLQGRDDHLGLEVESSYFLFDATPILADMFTDAHFILNDAGLLFVAMAEHFPEIRHARDALMDRS